MWRLRSEELLAGLGRKRRIIEGQDNIAYKDLACSLVLLDQRWKIVFLNISWPIPWSKESVFSKVPVANGVSNSLDRSNGLVYLSLAGRLSEFRSTSVTQNKPADIPVVGQVDFGAQT